MTRVRLCRSDRFVRCAWASSLDKTEMVTWKNGFGKRFVKTLTCMLMAEIMPQRRRVERWWE
jgi:hypothetical protein